jgi:predicted DNA-binding protein YlxM (UPF0122 family)
MGRLSVISDKQWQTIESRVLSGESIRSVAKDYHVSEGTIRSRINTQTKPIKNIANQLASAELALESMPINTQVKIRTLADELKDISHHLASTARLGVMTANRLATIANVTAEKINEDNPIESEEAIKVVKVLGGMVNEHTHAAISLMNSNKEQVVKLSMPEEKEVRDINDFYSEQADIKSVP